jgi:hypothetical protein
LGTSTIGISTSNYAPEFGRAGGAVTNVILRSGTNSFHGSVFEYNEVAALEARGYFNSQGVKAGLTNNYYGATIGGPIQRDRTFFFADFLMYGNHNESHNIVSVPTAAFRAGNYARLGWDQTHMFRQSFLYPLPFGAHGAYLQHGIAGKIVGGWELGGSSRLTRELR